MDDIHPIRLSDPEEDFLCLMPLAACFILVVAVPATPWLWRISRLDADSDEEEKRELMKWYRASIQRHLYVFGRDKRFLSKNASFSGMSQSLLSEFPDSRILFTVRDPRDTVPSQISSLRPALELCGYPEVDTGLRDRLVDLLAHYYIALAHAAEGCPERVAMLYNHELRDNLDQAVLRSLAKIGLDASPQFRAELEVAADASQHHKSSHEYSLEEFGLSEKLIASRFATVYDTYEFDSTDPGENTST